MRAVNFDFSVRMNQKFQIGGNAPTIAVFLRQRNWDFGKKAEGIHPNQEWYQLTNRAISVEIQQHVDQFASSFTVVLANEEGELSPDNYESKFPLENKFRGHQYMSYNRQLYPNNEIMIYLGFGDELIPYIKGYIGDTKVSSDGSTVGVNCMTSYKHLIHQTLKKDVKSPTGNLFEVLKFFFRIAGVVLNGKNLVIPGTDEQWIIKKPIVGKKGQAIDELVRDIIDTTYNYIRPEIDGSCTLIEIPLYEDNSKFDASFDEGFNLTNLDYTGTDQDVYSGVTVTSGNQSNSFINPYLLNTVSLGKFKEETINVEWADTFRKRQEVAKSHHLQNIQKWRTLVAGIVLDPRLQLWDTVRVREQVTAATGIYQLKGIGTIVSEMGAFQTLEMSNLQEIAPLSVTDLATVATESATARIRIVLKPEKPPLSKPSKAKPVPPKPVKGTEWMNILVNGKVAFKNYVSSASPSTVTVNLKTGENEITIEGVTCNRKELEATIHLLNPNNSVMLAPQDIKFLKTGVDKHGIYDKRPAQTILVTRT